MDIPVKKDEVYVLCPCGRSQKYPFCDGSHKGSGIFPIRYKTTKTKVVQFVDGQIKES
jgi:CDGSH-type Zn-finger protein